VQPKVLKDTKSGFFLEDIVAGRWGVGAGCYAGRSVGLIVRVRQVDLLALFGQIRVIQDLLRQTT